MRASVVSVSLIESHPTYTVEVRSVAPTTASRSLLYRFSAFRELHYAITKNNNNHNHNSNSYINTPSEPFPVAHKRQSIGISLSNQLLEQRRIALDKWLASLVDIIESLSIENKCLIFDFLHVTNVKIKNHAQHDDDGHGNNDDFTSSSSVLSSVQPLQHFQKKWAEMDLCITCLHHKKIQHLHPRHHHAIIITIQNTLEEEVCISVVVAGLEVAM